MISFYDVPSSYDELFENGSAEYSIVDYEIDSMDNYASMEFFLSNLEVSPSEIVENYGTQVILKHDNFSYLIQVDAGGLGDFYSHSFEVQLIKNL